MQTKDSKKIKVTNSQNINVNPNNKHIEENILINKLFPKNKISKVITANNSNFNILSKKSQESKINNNTQSKLTKHNTNLDKEKNISILNNNNDKINSEKKMSKLSHSTNTKQKTPNKGNFLEKPQKKKIAKKNTTINEQKKNPFLRSKTLYEGNINNEKKRKKSDNVFNKPKIEKKEKINKNLEKESGFNTKKLLEFLISLSPIDTSKCDDLISNNMNKIIELENKIGEISKMTQLDIIKITSDENNKDNKITTKQNIEIINKESNMRKDIYKLFFNFITELLEQINKLSNNIANHEINDLNFGDNYSSNDLFINSNISSDLSNNSLFVSNIEEEFCERLINITKSFVSSDFDLNDFKSNFDNEDKKELFNEEENKIIDNSNNEYNCVQKNKNKKLNVHPNEILDRVNNEENNDKKVIHHYSNSLKVNSNLEKLEGKINDDTDNMNNDTLGTLGNLEKLKNCTIF